MRVAFSELRKRGHESVVYLGDSYLQATSQHQCMLNIHDTATWLMKLGFVIHPTKSVPIPTQEINFVGLCLNLTRMVVCFPQYMSLAIREGCDSLTANPHPTIREVARVIGSLVASFPAAPFGKLYYRSLEMDKIKAFSNAKG